MKFTKEELREVVEALTQSKAHLSLSMRDDKHKFICHALHDTLHPGYSNAQIIVLEAISPHFTFGQWAEQKLGHWPGDKRVQQLRHEWVDQLIGDINQQIEDAP